MWLPPRRGDAREGGRQVARVRRRRRRSPARRPQMPFTRRQIDGCGGRRFTRRGRRRETPVRRAHLGPRAHLQRRGCRRLRSQHQGCGQGCVAEAPSRFGSGFRRRSGEFRRKVAKYRRLILRWHVHAGRVRVDVRRGADERAQRQGAAPAHEVRRVHDRRGGRAGGPRPMARRRKRGASG